MEHAPTVAVVMPAGRAKPTQKTQLRAAAGGCDGAEHAQTVSVASIRIGASTDV